MASSLSACCDSTRTWQSHFDEANVIFLGTCRDVSPNPIKGGLNILFEVDSSWKRRIEQVSTVHTNSEMQCGFPFRRGERYIVFGNKKHQAILTDACSPNVNITSETDFPPGLGQGFGPGRPEMARKMTLILIIMGALGMLFVAFVVLRKRIFGQKDAAT
ncbi:MAG: hypothetical protein AAF570_01945 [Bacteroidota bacterium]